MTKILGRDDFLGDLHLQRELVEVPELNGSLWIRELTTPQMLEFRRRSSELSEPEGKLSPEAVLELMALVVSFSACDEGGALLFAPEDIKRLAENRLPMLERLATRALELSGVDFQSAQGVTDPVAADLKKSPMPSSSSSSPRSSGKRRRRS